MTDASRGQSHSARTFSIANRIPLGSNLLLATRVPATQSWSRRATLSASDRIQVTRFRPCERPCGSRDASWMKTYGHLGGCTGVSRTRTTAPQRSGAYCPQHEQVPDDMRAVNAIVEQEHARAERIPQAAGDEQDQERAWHASNQGRGRHLHHHPAHRQIECRGTRVHSRRVWLCGNSAGNLRAGY